MSEVKRSRELLKEFNSLQERQKGEELLRLLPQGHKSGLNADLLDGLHADEIIEQAYGKLVLKGRPRFGVGASQGAPPGASYVTVEDETASLVNSSRFQDLNINVLQGIITDAQHGTKTSIPNAHHNRKHSLISDSDHEVNPQTPALGQGLFYYLVNPPDEYDWRNVRHTHATAWQSWTKEAASEVSTSSETYVDLIATIRKPFTEQHVLMFLFTHQAKNEGTLAARGADYKIVGIDDYGEFDITGADMRWTDGLADYKQMTAVFAKLQGDAFGDLGFKVKWKVDNSSYPAWSKNRFFSIKSWTSGSFVERMIP